jgi:hypothetical protein
MGLSPSLAQINEVPSIVQYESFAELCRSSSDLLKQYDVDRVGNSSNNVGRGDDSCDDSSSDRLLKLYRTIQDRSDYLSKERLLEYAEMIDCYISYEWGIDKLHRNTVDRVKKINQYLRSKGLYTYIDEGHDFTTNTLKKYELTHRAGSSSASLSHDGNDYMILQPHDMTKQRISYAQCILICVTSSYLQKLRLKTKEKHPIQFEFDYFMTIKEDRVVILLNMEDESLSADRLLCMLPAYVHERYPSFHEKRLFNMVHMETHPQQLDNVYECVLSFIVPVRQGGPYRRERDVFNATIVGRHYHWFLRSIPSLGHDLSLKYANTLHDNHIESTIRLWQIIQYDEGFLIDSLSLTADHALMVVNALRKDLKRNMDPLVLKEIPTIIREENKEFIRQTEANHLMLRKHVEKSRQLIEADLMTTEDYQSIDLRDYYQNRHHHYLFNQTRLELKKTCIDRNDALLIHVDQANEDFQALAEDNSKRWLDGIFNGITNISDPEAISSSLYKLCIKIDQNTTYISEDKMNLDRFAYDDDDDDVDSDSYDDSSNHDHIQKVQFLYAQPIVVSPDERGQQMNRLPSLTNGALKADDGRVKFKKNGLSSSSSSSSSSSVDRRKLNDNNDDNVFGKKNSLIDPYNQGNDNRSGSSHSSNSSHRSYNSTGLDVSVDSSNTIVDKGSKSNNKSYDNKVAVLPTDIGFYGIATLLTDIQKKKERIRRFIHRCSRDGETINVKQMLENYYHNKQLSFEQAQSNQYHVLLQLVEEACYICRAIYYICLNATPDDTTTTNSNSNNNNNNNNISHRSIISRFLNTGLVKLLIVMLTKVYLFQCSFDNPSLPMEYRGLHMPEQLLIAIRYLIKCGEYMSMSMSIMSMSIMMMMIID